MMSCFLAIWIYCGITMVGVSGLDSAKSDSSAAHRQVIVEYNNRLAMHIMRDSVKEGKNFISSPWSVYNILMYLLLLASDESASQIQRITTGSYNEYAALELMQHAIERLEHLEHIRIKTGSFFLIKDTLKITEYATEVLQNSSITLDYFSNLGAINKKIADQFNSGSKGSLGKDMNIEKPDSRTQALLYNFIHFKGDWLNKFSKDKTKKEPFHVEQNGKKCQVKVDTMNAKIENFLSYTHKSFVSIGLPFAGEKLAFVVLLPKGDTKLNEALNSVASNMTEVIEELFLDYNRQTCKIKLPKFDIKYKYSNMQPLMEQLGVVDIFDEQAANFVKIDPNKGLYVSKIVHKAFIKIDEDGGEAGAATQADIVDHIIGYGIKVNRPFGFFIVDITDNKILFAGAYFQPEIATSSMKCEEKRVIASQQERRQVILYKP